MKDLKFGNEKIKVNFYMKIICLYVKKNLNNSQIYHET